MNKALIVVIVVIVALVIVGYASFYGRDSGEDLLNDSGLSGRVSQSQLSEHAVEEDCWVAYNGTVYDITDWLPRHPGSAAAIRPYCGTAEEFEQAFTGQHGTSQIGRLMEEGVVIGSYTG